MKSTPVANLRKSSLALAVLAAVFAGSAIAGSSSNALVSVAHPTTLRHGDAVMGPLAVAQPVHVEVALKLRNKDALDAFVKNSAKNPGAVKPMTSAQFLANHAPDKDQVNAVVSYLTSMGYKNIVVAPNRLLVSADGTAATAQKAFSTTLVQVKTREGRVAFANNDEVRIPASLQGHVLSVLGLQTVNMAHVIRPRRQGSAHSMAITGHNPVEFSSIYGATGVPTAAGVTVGIFASGDVTPSITDLNAFTTENSLAAVSTSIVKTNGGGNDTSGVDEWDIDSQDIVGMGGGEVGGLIFYTAPSLSDSDMTANFNTIVGANATKIINVSIGGCELSAQQSGTAAAVDQILQTGVAQGQTFSISTGDFGADECGDGGTTPSWPADSPYVVAVAGTTLDASTTTRNDETEWAESGGSPSTFEPKPDYQQLIVPGNFRGVADVAFDADPNSGCIVNFNGGHSQFGGTSLSAPIFAGMWARVLAVKGQDFGFANPLIYALPQADFFDIVSGNNGGETAKVGYDFASGRGAIILNTAINHIGQPIGLPPVANFSYTVAGLSVHFHDSSSDPDGTIIKHIWNFGDGSPVSNQVNPVHIYVGAGTYHVSETVADNDFNVNTKSVDLTVAPASLIKNTGFETGITPWVFSSPGLLNNNSAEPAHGGQWDAWLGGTGHAHTDSIAQTIMIPATKTSATLSYWLHIDTNEISTIRKFDKLTVGVYTPAGALLGTVGSFSNLDKATGYALHTADLSSFIGQKITLKFIATEDASIQTSFVIDDVTVK
jgi:subtilase family serine protease